MSSELPDTLELGPPDATCSVIWLHGLGADGYDFEPIVPELGLPADLKVRFVFPHAPHRPVTINNGFVMRAWYDIAAAQINAAEDAVGISASAGQLEALVARETARGVMPGNIVLAGFSQGGAIALYTGLRYGERLAGILALSTYLPLAQSFDANDYPANRDVPIFMAHGTYDPIIPIALAAATRTQLEGADYALEWHDYPMDHSVVPDEIDHIGVWLQRVLAREASDGM
ncbi:MAG: dienelactone hydrolase family protein [Pseudomonadota bacterium]|nr:MAG: dienelactone hydrolase family protein [Pseudomonadota bacterium]